MRQVICAREGREEGLAAQWVGLCTPSAGALGLGNQIPQAATKRYCMPQ